MMNWKQRQSGAEFPVLKLQQGQKLQFGDATMKILSPEPGCRRNRSKMKRDL